MSDSEKEFPDGVSAGQLYTIPTVHEYVRERSEETDRTMSEYLAEEVVPDDHEEVVHSNERAIVKVTPEVNDMFSEMAGSRVEKGEVLAYYVILDAIEKDNVEDLSPALGTVSDLFLDGGDHVN